MFLIVIFLFKPTKEKWKHFNYLLLVLFIFASIKNCLLVTMTNNLVNLY